MIVEWYGGPHDGETIQVMDGTKSLQVPMLDTSMSFTEAKSIDELVIHSVTLPIWVDYTTYPPKYFIRYPKNRKTK
jgi:hypothetical protein